ncbi:hypothetical protein ACGF3G_00610 [Streptomyces sp. NPDC048179]|uniref:hypothetical protein n=1 Tax=Streptomyces sp. NPDC048179 TaxID=3365506 RepID=UPI00371E8B60
MDTVTNTVFISPALVRAAREAAALDQRIGGEGFASLTIKVGLYGKGWSLDDNADAILRRADGSVLYCSPFRPAAERMPASIKAMAERRYAAAQELRRLVAGLPFTGEGLRIPLHAAH